MIIYKQAGALRNKIDDIRQAGKTIGFVPTMGALHRGHTSLIEESVAENNITICSIFVNPTQFNDPKDFEKYPSNISNDILLLVKTGCDILFFPPVAEMYPEGIEDAQQYDLGDVEFLLEGKYRPGHFQGVCQIVHKLLEMIKPDFLYIGQKDFQQCIVIRRLVQLINVNTKVKIVSTVREDTGLAMSSRNLRLNEEQRKNAAGIYRMLVYINEHVNLLPISELEKYVINYLLNHGFDKVDYVALADEDTLQPATENRGKLVALIAAFIGEVRLIDNILLHS